MILEEQLNQFIRYCDELYDKAADNDDYREAIIRIAAQIIADDGYSNLAMQVINHVSDKYKTDEEE